MKLHVGQRVKFKDFSEHNPWSGVDAVVESISDTGLVRFRKGTELRMGAEMGTLALSMLPDYIIAPVISFENK